MRNLIKGIKNIWKWKKIIYFNREYDYTFNLELLRFQLENQAKYFNNSNIAECDKRNAEILMTCVRLINKIKEEDYQLEYQNCYFYLENAPGWLFLMEFEDEQKIEKYFYNNRRIYNQIMKMKKPLIEDKESNLAVGLYIGILKHEKAKRLLFKILENKIEHFWN